jgi:hypothetical protein
MKAIFAAFAATLLALSSPASAQAPGGAEARLKSLNITLPPDAAPAANFVNSVQSGTKVEPAINMKTAKSLGLTFPLSVLGRADEGDLNNGASCPSWVIFDRRTRSPLTAAYPPIASVPGGCHERQSWARSRHICHSYESLEEMIASRTRSASTVPSASPFLPVDRLMRGFASRTHDHLVSATVRHQSFDSRARGCQSSA